MKLNIQTSLLVDSFTKAYSIIERRSSIPVLSHVLMKTSGEQLVIQTTDLDHSLEDIVEADVSHQGAALVQAQTFYEILKKSESEVIQLEMIGEELLVRSKSAEFRLTTLNPEEFPETPKIENEKSFMIKAPDLKKLLDLTYFSMSNDETRYNLNGVYLHNEGPQICAVATDAHRLALVKSGEIKSFNDQKLNMILSKKTVLEYRKLLDGIDTEVLVYLNNVYIALKVKNITFLSRLVDATFPEYTHIIPKDANETFVTVDRKTFIDAVNRVSIVADEKSPLIKFNIFEQKLTISSNSINKGHAEESIVIRYSGAECNLGFNPRYLLDIATNLSSKEIDIYFKDSLSAIIIKEVGNDSSLFMVMPMLVN